MPYPVLLISLGLEESGSGKPHPELLFLSMVACQSSEAYLVGHLKLHAQPSGGVSLLLLLLSAAHYAAHLPANVQQATYAQARELEARRIASAIPQREKQLGALQRNQHCQPLLPRSSELDPSKVTGKASYHISSISSFAKGSWWE